jgi:hypothetical protein
MAKKHAMVHEGQGAFRHRVESSSKKNRKGMKGMGRKRGMKK